MQQKKPNPLALWGVVADLNHIFIIHVLGMSDEIEHSLMIQHSNDDNSVLFRVLIWYQ